MQYQGKPPFTALLQLAPTSPVSQEEGSDISTTAPKGVLSLFSQNQLPSKHDSFFPPFITKHFKAMGKFERTVWPTAMCPSLVFYSQQFIQVVIHQSQLFVSFLSTVSIPSVIVPNIAIYRTLLLGPSQFSIRPCPLFFSPNLTIAQCIYTAFMLDVQTQPLSEHA